MERLCFLSPDQDHARQVVADLRNEGIQEKHIYAVARHGIELEQLPDAGPDADDFLPAYQRGLAFGGSAGLLAGLTALAFPPAGIVVGGGLVLLIGLWGAGLGGMLAGIAGASYASSRLQKFEQALEEGRILIMVDVPGSEVARFETLIRRRDPDVGIEGVEPPAPLVP